MWKKERRVSKLWARIQTRIQAKIRARIQAKIRARVPARVSLVGELKKLRGSVGSLHTGGQFFQLSAHSYLLPQRLASTLISFTLVCLWLAFRLVCLQLAIILLIRAVACRYLLWIRSQLGSWLKSWPKYWVGSHLNPAFVSLSESPLKLKFKNTLKKQLRRDDSLFLCP